MGLLMAYPPSAWLPYTQSGFNVVVRDENMLSVIKKITPLSLPLQGIAGKLENLRPLQFFTQDSCSFHKGRKPLFLFVLSYNICFI